MKIALLIFILSTRLFATSPVIRESLLSLDSEQLLNPQKYGRLLLEKKRLQEVLNNHTPSQPNSKPQLSEGKIEFRQIEPHRFLANFSFIPIIQNDSRPIAIPVLPKSWVLQSITGFTPQISTEFPEYFLYQADKANHNNRHSIDFIVDLTHSNAIQLPPLPQLEIIFSQLTDQFLLSYPHKNIQIPVKKLQHYHISDVEQIIIKAHNDQTLVAPALLESKEQPAAEEFTTIEASGTYSPQIQINLASEQIEVFAHYQINIVHGKVNRLAHHFGNFEFESLRFQPPIPFQYNAKYFSFPEGLSQAQTLILRARINHEPNNYQFQVPELPDLKMLSGTIYFISKDNIRLETVESSELEQIVSLPHTPLENLELPILSQYRFSQAANMRIKTSLLLPQTKKQSHIIETTLTTVISDEYKIATAISLQVLNAGAKTFSMDLPPHSTVLGSYVDSKPIRSFQDEQGRFTINLPLSEQQNNQLKPLQVEIKYMEPARTEQNKKTPISLSLPQGLPSSFKTVWNIYFPQNLRIKKLISNLENTSKLKIPPHELYVLQNTYFNFLTELRQLVGHKLMLLLLIMGGPTLCYLAFRFWLILHKIYQQYKISKIVLVIGGALLVLATLILLPNMQKSRMKANYQPVQHRQEVQNWQMSDAVMSAPPPAGAMGRGFVAKERSARIAPAELKASAFQLQERASALPSLEVREKVSHKKVEKSDVKPVKVIFPRLPSELNLVQKKPLEEPPKAQITFAPLRNKTQGYSLFFLIFTVLAIISIKALYHKKYLIFAINCCVAVFLQIYYLPSSLSINFIPFLFFVLLVHALIYLKKLPLAGLLFLIPAHYADIPSHLDVYRIYDPVTKDFPYGNYYLLNQKDWEKLNPTQTLQATSQAVIEKQFIEIEPNYQTNILKIYYKLELSCPPAQNFPLFRANANFQIIKVQADKQESAIIRQAKRGQDDLLLPANTSAKSYEIWAELPIKVQSFDELRTDLPIAAGLINQLKNNSSEKETDIPQAVLRHDSFFFAAEKNYLTLIFRKLGSSKKPMMMTDTKISLPNIQNRSIFVAKDSQLRVEQEIHPKPPYLFFSNQFYISHKDNFSIILPENAILHEFEFIGQKWQSGIDYGIKKEKNTYYLSFPPNIEQMRIKASWYTKEEQLNYYLPFNPQEFPNNSLTIQLKPTGERNLELQVADFLEQFRSSAFSIDLQQARFENIKSGDSSAFKLTIAERKTVSFAAVRCLYYYLHVLLLDQIAYQEVNFYLNNNGSQFLALNLPANTELEHAAINNENLIPVKENQNSSLLLLPLKKYLDNKRLFRISLLLKTKLEKKDNNEKYFSIPIPQTDVEKFFLQISSSKHQIQFKDNNLDWLEGASSAFQTMPFYPLNHDTKKAAITVKLPDGAYQWHSQRNNLPEQLTIKYQEQKTIPEKEEELELATLLELFFVLLFFAFVYQKADHLKEQNNKLVIVLLIILLPLFFLLERIFIYFYLIMSIGWLLSLKLRLVTKQRV